MLPQPPTYGHGLPPPPPSPHAGGLPFIKLTPGQRQSITILSHHWFAALTHYAGGRTKLCLPPDCAYCKSGSKIRWYAWLHILTPKMLRQWLCQFSPGQHGVLLAAHDTYGTLRGCPAVLARPGSAPNTPLQIQINGPPTVGNHLPEPADVPALLTIYMDWFNGQPMPTPHPEAFEGGTHT